MTFEEHKEKTAQDLEAMAGFITELAGQVRAGDTEAFERFWYEGGTEEGDAKILALRENLLIRYFYRKQNIPV